MKKISEHEINTNRVFFGLIGISAETDHLIPFEIDHRIPQETDHLIPRQIDHLFWDEALLRSAAKRIWLKRLHSPDKIKFYGQQTDSHE